MLLRFCSTPPCCCLRLGSFFFVLLQAKWLFCDRPRWIRCAHYYTLCAWKSTLSVNKICQFPDGASAKNNHYISMKKLQSEALHVMFYFQFAINQVQSWIRISVLNSAACCGAQWTISQTAGAHIQFKSNLIKLFEFDNRARLSVCACACVKAKNNQ